MNKKRDAIEFAPLRSLDDFLIESARFQIPNFQDWEKWGKRVTSNLLYYQTNYFLLSVFIFMMIAVLHPVKMLCGSIIMFIIFVIFCYFTNEAGNLGQIKRNYPIISAVVVFAIGYFIIHNLMGSMVIFLLGILVPFCVTFIHASLRLRNLKNKLVNSAESLGFKNTPMGKFLEEMGLDREVI